jgi:hypothetical protein
MTIQEIYEQVLLDVPKLIMRNFIKRYNEAVDVLSTRYDTANMKKTDYIDATDSEQVWYDLPSDCKGVNKVTTEDNRELRSYVCERDKIRFGFTGNFAIEYIGMPTKITKLEKTPMYTGIHESFHMAIVKYILAYEQSSEMFKFNMGLFEELAAKADERLRSMKRKNLRIPVRPFR